MDNRYSKSKDLAPGIVKLVAALEVGWGLAGCGWVRARFVAQVATDLHLLLVPGVAPENAALAVELAQPSVDSREYTAVLVLLLRLCQLMLGQLDVLPLALALVSVGDGSNSKWNDIVLVVVVGWNVVLG